MGSAVGEGAPVARKGTPRRLQRIQIERIVDRAARGARRKALGGVLRGGGELVDLHIGVGGRFFHLVIKGIIAAVESARLRIVVKTSVLPTERAVLVIVIHGESVGRIQGSRSRNAQIPFTLRDGGEFPRVFGIAVRRNRHDGVARNFRVIGRVYPVLRGVDIHRAARNRDDAPLIALRGDIRAFRLDSVAVCGDRDDIPRFHRDGVLSLNGVIARLDLQGEILKRKILRSVNPVLVAAENGEGAVPLERKVALCRDGAAALRFVLLALCLAQVENFVVGILFCGNLHLVGVLEEQRRRRRAGDGGADKLQRDLLIGRVHFDLPDQLSRERILARRRDEVSIPLLRIGAVRRFDGKFLLDFHLILLGVLRFSFQIRFRLFDFAIFLFGRPIGHGL